MASIAILRCYHGQYQPEGRGLDLAADMYAIWQVRRHESFTRQSISLCTSACHRRMTDGVQYPLWSFYLSLGFHLWAHCDGHTYLIAKLLMSPNASEREILDRSSFIQYLLTQVVLCILYRPCGHVAFRSGGGDGRRTVGSRQLEEGQWKWLRHEQSVCWSSRMSLTHVVYEKY